MADKRITINEQFDHQLAHYMGRCRKPHNPNQKTRARCYWRSNVPIADVFHIEFPNGTVWDLGLFADPRAKENPWPLDGESIDIIVRYNGMIPAGRTAGRSGTVIVNLAETPQGMNAPLVFGLCLLAGALLFWLWLFLDWPDL